jgi:Uncharacterised nucleotidyltransferase
VCRNAFRVSFVDSHQERLLPDSSIRPDPLSAEWRALLECATPQSDSARLQLFLGAPLAWPAFLALAQAHGTLPLVEFRLRDVDPSLIPPEIRQLLRETLRTQAVFTLSLTAELFRLLNEFDSIGVPVLITKGPALSVRCYGDPGLRQYGDLDLIVRGKDIERVTTVMLGLGYRAKVSPAAIKARKLPGEYVFTKPGTQLLVEFHTEDTFRYYPRAVNVETLLQRSARVPFDGGHASALSLEDELLLICIHGAKHFWQRLMWIADVAAFITRQPVRWDLAMSIAQNVAAQRMLLLGLRLASNVLKIELPAAVAATVHRDPAVARLAAQIAERLPVPDSEPSGLLGRALFRARTRGGFISGARYLLKLSVSPTEEDWVAGDESKPSGVRDSIARPFRLARKYRR